jgi:hypothetical protein
MTRTDHATSTDFAAARRSSDSRNTALADGRDHIDIDRRLVVGFGTDGDYFVQCYGCCNHGMRYGAYLERYMAQCPYTREWVCTWYCAPTYAPTVPGGLDGSGEWATNPAYAPGQVLGA